MMEFEDYKRIFNNERIASLKQDIETLQGIIELLNEQIKLRDEVISDLKNKLKDK